MGARPYRGTTREKYLRKRSKKFRKSALHARKRMRQNPGEKTSVLFVSTKPINVTTFMMLWYDTGEGDDREE